MNPTPPDAIDLHAYFQRIGYKGEPAPTLETLQAIHLSHATSIAFENLSPLLKQPVPLDLPSLQQKLIHQRRGGYCFEHNLLLRSVLSAIGFQVTNLAARVLWNLPKGTITPRSHMLLKVEIDGKTYIADVGFGGLTLTAPLLLSPDTEQRTPHELFRLLLIDHTYILQALINQEWRSLYCFDLQVQQLPDYEVSNWYISTHPNSLFVNSLIAARPDADRRYGLRNNHLIIHYLDNRTDRKLLNTATELRFTLEELFQIQLPDTPDLDLVLQHLIEQSPHP